MKTYAAVTTAKAASAIATINLAGKKAEAILKSIFKAAGDKKTKFEPGKIFVGDIVNKNDVIDEVVIGCEGQNAFSIGCHGNWLIVSDIMKLLQKKGAELIEADEFLAKTLEGQNSIAIEAKITQSKAQSLVGVKIASYQITEGLSNWANENLENNFDLEQLKTQARQILKKSKIASYLLYGVKILIAGPVNSGKSSLLNCLAGQQKAIVTDIKGTTRDWITGQCKMGQLKTELIDTAGLNEKLTAQGDIDKESQQKSIQLLTDCDLVLLVLDSSKGIEQLEQSLLGKLKGKKVLAVLNKSDLDKKIDAENLPTDCADVVEISAKDSVGIETLSAKIQDCLGVIDFNVSQPICITTRQQNLLFDVIQADNQPRAKDVIQDLLIGEVSV